MTRGSGGMVDARPRVDVTRCEYSLRLPMIGYYEEIGKLSPSKLSMNDLQI